MSMATFIEVLFMLVAGLVACTGGVLLIDHWRTRKRLRTVRAYEGLEDRGWPSGLAPRENPRDDENGTPTKDLNPAG